MVQLLQSLDHSYEELPEHCELVGGVLVRKAMPSFEHGDLQGRLRVLLDPYHGNRRQFGGWWFSLECEVELFPGERYLPDLAGWRIDRLPERPSGRPVQTPPHWVCEILSPSTAHRDLGGKKHHYHKADIAHYWVLHPEKKTLDVLRRDRDRYEVALLATAPDRVRAEPFAELEIDLGDLFER